MSKSLNEKKLRARFRTGTLAVAMSLSLAAFGCTTNQNMTSGEPQMMRPAGGSVTPSLSATPGVAGSSRPTMVSGGVDRSVDAVAVLEANRGFQGRVLGPAAPGNGGPSISAQYATGQFVPPAAFLGAQPTVNRSIGSDAVPAIVSGAGEVSGAGVLSAAAVGSGITAAATTGGVANAGTTADVTNANFGVTGESNTTATGLAGSTMAATNVGTNAPLAARTLGTSSILANGNPSAARGRAVRMVSNGGRVLVTNQSNR